MAGLLISFWNPFVGWITRIGEFSETLLSDEEVKQFQKYLVYNHAAGIGDPGPEIRLHDLY